MSIGPMSSLPGNQDAINQQRKISGQQKAEAASGVGNTDTDDQKAHDRDADGRRFWELPPENQENSPENQSSNPEDESTLENRRGHDPSGTSGGGLDITA